MVKEVGMGCILIANVLNRGITSELYEASFSVAANDFTEKEK